MALVTLSFIFTPGTTIVSSQTNLNNSTIYSDYNGNISDVNISPTAGIEYTKLALNNTIKSTDILSTTNFLPQNTGSGTATVATVLLGSGAWGSIPYIKLTNTQSSGNGGGSSTSGGWNVYPLNTTDTDTGSNVISLTSNTFILSAGTYEIDASFPIYAGNHGVTRLQNTTASTTILLGSVCLCGNSSEQQERSFIQGRFTVITTQSLQIQYLVEDSVSSTGLGYPAGLGVSEVFGIINLKRVA